jgi:broad specificity polyphosphatase/5'/3'-nucleotidase SurE
MKDRHQKEENKLKKNVEFEARQAETDEEARFKSEKEKQVFELQQRQAADRQARQDLHPAEMERVSITLYKIQLTFSNFYDYKCC